MKTIAQLLARLFPPLLAGTFGICAMLLFLRRADADPVVATSPPGFDWAFWLAIASAVGTALSFVLHRVALKTHNAKVEALAQDVDTLRGLVPTPAPTLAIAPAPRDKQAGFIEAPMWTVLCAIGGVLVLVIGLVTSCSTAPVQQLKSEGSAAVSSTLDCAKKLGPGQLEAGLVTLAGDIATAILQHGAIDWGALAAAAIADVTEVKTCALAEYHAVKSKQTSTTATAESALMSVNAPPADPLAAAIAQVKAARGVTAILTPAGGV